jgi:hypothetical protein
MNINEKISQESICECAAGYTLVVTTNAANDTNTFECAQIASFDAATHQYDNCLLIGKQFVDGTTPNDTSECIRCADGFHIQGGDTDPKKCIANA